LSDFHQIRCDRSQIQYPCIGVTINGAAEWVNLNQNIGKVGTLRVKIMLEEIKHTVPPERPCHGDVFAISRLPKMNKR
jgi:hypothetical protein